MTQEMSNVFPEGGQDVQAPAARARKGLHLSDLGASNLVLVALFGAGIAGVYLLSLRGGPAVASAEQEQVELRVETILGQMGSDTGAAADPAPLLDKDYYDMTRRQVPVTALRGNPFVFVHKPRQEWIPEANAGPAAQVEPEVPRGTEEMKAAAGELVLESVLMGRQHASAMISNNVLSEGQQIRGWTVESIQPRRVVLRWEDHTYVLKMHD